MSNKKSLSDKLTYAYLRKIKKWMFCPACQKGKMSINKSGTIWTCEDCGYQLANAVFEDDYVFWFCDECGTYLNNQEGFDRRAQKHICQSCGYENDTTFDNIKGMCSDCGKLIPDPDATLCLDCKHARREKAKQWLITAGKVVGAVAAVAGVAYLASQSSDDDSTDYLPITDGYDEGGSNMDFSYVTDYWLQTATEDELRETASEMERLMDELDYDSEEHTHIYGIHIDVVNAIASRFPLNLPHREHGWYLPNDD